MGPYTCQISDKESPGMAPAVRSKVISYRRFARLAVRPAVPTDLDKFYELICAGNRSNCSATSN